jgi:tetratricopeptide (TPR) repeat protein
MGALPRPDIAPGPHRELVDALHTLHHRAGWPSLRRLAGDTGVSHTTVSKMLSSQPLPGWGTLELLVEAMGGDIPRFHDLWLAASTPADASDRHALGIAGRQDELAVVRRHLESGSGLLLVIGEAGIGKTTLVGAAAESVGTFVAVGHCLQLSKEVPLLPVVDALRALLDVEDGQWMEEGLADCPAYVRTALSRLLPELDAAENAPPPEDPWGLERLFASATSILGALAATRPFALHVEDCHWADRSTLDLLTHLASAPPDVPMVLTWRSADPDVSSGHNEWLSRTRWTSGVAALDLGPLTLEETAQQLRLLTGANPDADAVERIQARSQGLPLYTAQLASGPYDAELPQHLADLLDRRIGDLDGVAWCVARVLGLAQRRVGPSLLRTASGLDVDETADGLRALALRGLLLRGTGDDAELSHPLFVDAIHRRLLPGEGAQVHACLAQAMSDEPNIEPAEIADHWQAGGHPDFEVSHRVAAATRAGDRFAYPEALDAWLRVLQLWDAGTTTDDMELWDVLAKALGTAFEISDFDTGRRLIQKAEVLDPPDLQRGVLLMLTGVFHIVDGKAEEGLAHLDKALELLEKLPPSEEIRELISERINYFMVTGRYEEAEAEKRRALEVFGAEEDPRWRRGLAESVWLTGLAGDVDQAMTVARDALAVALPIPDPRVDILIACSATGLMLLAARPPSAIEEMARDVLIQAEVSNLTRFYPGVLLRANVSSAYLRAGDLPAAHGVLRPVTRSHPDLNTAQAHRLLAAIELREGHVQSALERCRAADSQIHYRNQNWVEGVPLHAEIELWAGQMDAAIDLLEEALDVTLPTQAVFNVAPLLCLRARVLADRFEVVESTAAERRNTIKQLHDLRIRALTNPFEQGPLHAAIPALSHLWRAEIARIDGTGKVEPWVRAAAEFDRLMWPHDAAYCRWRAAQVALRTDAGTQASPLLRLAAADARTHVPLSEAIAATGHDRSGSRSHVDR